ncbi:MAG TPA: glutaredoxin family protein [Burkholderiales bacterium]|nr:glutaredoxin family protein [Burkholderiales bacterium]
MKKNIFVILALLLLTSQGFAAQLYRWVDEKGNVEWRDTPPPPTAKKIELRTIGAGAPQTTSLPYSLQLAVKNFPVALWANDCGELCDKARAHLSRRGVPHAERNPQSDPEGFKKVSGGDMAVPLLLVGNTKLRGYLESAWDSELDIAGYPRTALVRIKPAASAGAAPKTEKPQPAGDYPAPAQ